MPTSLAASARLVGADLTNLDKVRGLGAPVASIGGAGTFDGIFLTGILAVLFAGFYARPRAAFVGLPKQPPTDTAPTNQLLAKIRQYLQ